MIALDQQPEPVSDGDKELIFFAGVLHEMGTTDLLRGQPRFELQGADFAADFLRKEGMSDSRIDKVWEAIAPCTPRRRFPSAAAQ